MTHQRNIKVKPPRKPVKAKPKVVRVAERIADALQEHGYKYYACDVPHDGKCPNCRAIISAIVDRELRKARP